jgi:hypothetical protein
MERMRMTSERMSDIDYLSEKLNIFVEFEAEAAEFLPKITDDALETRKEKYAVLLGIVKQMTGDTLKVTIKGVLEMENENHRLWQEGVESVSNVDLKEIKRMAHDIQISDPQYKEYTFLGDVHTHPILPDVAHNFFPNLPSQPDIDTIISEYERGDLNPNEPYIFMIAAPDEYGKTLYSIYRMTKNDKGYAPQRLD